MQIHADPTHRLILCSQICFFISYRYSIAQNKLQILVLLCAESYARQYGNQIPLFSSRQSLIGQTHATIPVLSLNCCKTLLVKISFCRRNSTVVLNSLVGPFFDNGIQTNIPVHTASKQFDLPFICIVEQVWYQATSKGSQPFCWQQAYICNSIPFTKFVLSTGYRYLIVNAWMVFSSTYGLYTHSHDL